MQSQIPKALHCTQYRKEAKEQGGGEVEGSRRGKGKEEARLEVWRRRGRTCKSSETVAPALTLTITPLGLHRPHSPASFTGGISTTCSYLQRHISVTTILQILSPGSYKGTALGKINSFVLQHDLSQTVCRMLEMFPHRCCTFPYRLTFRSAMLPGDGALGAECTSAPS